MQIELGEIANARSGDKGANSNVGVLFKNKDIYNWAKKHLTVDIVKNHFQSIVNCLILVFHLVLFSHKLKLH